MPPRCTQVMLRRKIVCACVVVAGCAAGQASSGSKSTAPGEWPTLGAARADFQKNEHDFDLAATDCTLACKALASLERAADHLCAVSDPDECADARARVDRAKRAVQTQCGGC